MKKWILKAIVQKSISILPFRYKINRVFQKYVTKGLDLNDEHFGFKITHARDHVDFMLKYKNTTDLHCLELGTGWYPIIPISLYLNGVNKTHTIDVAPHITEKSIKTTIQKFMEWDAQGKLKAYFPQLNTERWAAFVNLHQNMTAKSLDELLAFFHISPIVADARKTDFENDYFDFICSNNTFEHIYKDVLVGILKEFRRILKPDGVMSHFIDMSDHFAHFDKSITVYNFLQFSEPQWKLIDNSIQPQNRMRFPTHRELHQQSNFNILEESVRKGNIEQVKALKISPHFTQAHSTEELAISHGYIVSNKSV